MCTTSATAPTCLDRKCPPCQSDRSVEPGVDVGFVSHRQRYLHLPAVPDLRYDGSDPVRSARRCRSRRLLPQGRPFARRSDEVPRESSRTLPPQPARHVADACMRGSGSYDQVYNARKRGGDNATQYFARTENIAGVKDMRHQELMPDVLHWLGIKKIDNVSLCSLLCLE